MRRCASRLAELPRNRVAASVWLIFTCLCACVWYGYGDPPDSRKPEVIPWKVWPDELQLVGACDGAQLVVCEFAQGSFRDLTRRAEYRRVPSDLVHVDASGWIEPKRDGSGHVEVRVAGFTRKVPVRVIGLAEPPSVSFHRQVMAALNVGGCNGGTCHGSPSGKNGFRLSLWGAEPAFDYFALTRELGGRRTSAISPGESLILRKALGRIPHEGGVRFSAESLPARVLENWLRNAMPNDSPVAAPPKLQVEPGHAVLREPERQVQLAVRANFPGENWRDVTRLTVFQSSDPTLAVVSPTGLVTFRRAGEVAILCRYLTATTVVRLACLQPRTDFAWQAPPEKNAVDRFVFAKLRELQIRPAALCSDSVFLRRVYLDLLGRLPSVAETQAFLNDADPQKREKLVDRLLADPEFAEFWTRKWLDVLRANQKRLPLDVLVGFQRWWQQHLHHNTPFDQLVRQLLTATGDTLTSPAAAYFTIHATPEDLAETTAQVFLGVRIGCARCHNHPFDRWTQEDYYGLAACFARVDRRNEGKANRRQPVVQTIADKNDGEVLHPRTGRPVPPKPLLSASPFPASMNRRAALADWVTARDNPFFARALANRIWYHLFGSGIIDPPDDLRDTNPPSNDALLDFLAGELAAHQFDCKHLIRLIVCSATYQLASEPASENAEEFRLFARVRPRLLTAEQLLDAISQVTEVPESFPNFSGVRRAVALPDSLPGHPFLSAFGQPPRELPCECERHTEPNLAQALQLVSGSTVHKKVTAPNNRLGRLLQAKASDEDILAELYLAAFSRLPAESEKQTVLRAVREQTDRRSGWEDVLWTLLNSSEFLYRP